MCAAATPCKAQAFGRFEGPIRVEFSADGRTMRLLEDVSYVDPDDRRWTARKGYSTDGASIPRAFWTVVGGPFEGRYRDAALIHDQFCSDPNHGLRTWQQVHRMFYFAMRASGVTEIESKVLYAAVFLGGPRWTTPCPACASISAPERDREGRLLTAPPIANSHGNGPLGLVLAHNVTIEFRHDLARGQVVHARSSTTILVFE